MITRNILSAAALAVLSGAFATTSATAATIVNWGGDYVSTTREFSNKINLGYGGFDENGDPKLLAPASGYTGGNFYGAVLKDGTSSNSQVNSIANSGVNDLINLKVNTGSTGAFLLLWNQPDFLQGQAGNVSLDANSSIRLNGTKWTEPHATDSGRVVLQLAGGNYYVSDQVFTGVADTTLSGAALLGLSFYDYDPISSINLNSSSLVLASIGDGTSINGITSIGFYIETTDQANSFQIANFTVVATAIPEPGTYAMLAGAICLVGAAVRRRRR